MASDSKLDTSKIQWDLSPLYSSDDDPKIKKDLKKAEEETLKFIKKWKDRTDYLEDPNVLKEALVDSESHSKHFGIDADFGYYIGLRSSQDETDPKIKARINKLHERNLDLVNQIQFFSLSISKIPEPIQKKMLSSDVLKDYKHLLELSFREGKYVLSEPEEKIINLTSKTSYGNWVSMISEFFSKSELEVEDRDGKKVKKPFNEVIDFLSDKDSKVRSAAAKEIEKTFVKHLDATEAEINSILEYKSVKDKMRGYERADSSSILGDDVTHEIVDTLVESVKEDFSTPKRYYDFKARLLGQDKLKYFERMVEYGEITKKYTYEDSIKLIDTVFEELDHEFSDIFKGFVENGNFDVFPKKGKRGGAFCAGGGLLQPSYILLNHNDRLNDVLTIAHEVGHGINNELIKKKQNALNYGTPLSTAEVASTFMEDFVLDKLLEDVNEEEELAIRMMRLDADIATIYRQIAFYRFETELHNTFREKGFLPKEEIGKIFKEHMESYMGDAAEGSENWWAYVSHFRRFFYVYSYASGLLISKALQAKVKEDKGFIAQVKVFLSTGLVESPQEIFSKMGIDITDKAFWVQGLAEIDTYLEDTIKLAKKLGKI